MTPNPPISLGSDGIAYYQYRHLKEDEPLLKKVIREHMFSNIVGIYRGGLIPAVIASTYGKIPLSIIGFQTRAESDKEPYWIHNIITKGKTLVIDDFYDSGKTMKPVMDMIPDSLGFALVASDRDDLDERLSFSRYHPKDKNMYFPW